ncbi:MAG: MFS transporter [Alphaproteobacteria bacterium]|nr:MFS transporter [Alphaproteobacteria bacterium]
MTDSTAATGKHAPYPTPTVAWTMVILLTLAYILSFVDRYILSLLVEPIKADLELTDTQIGLLLGPAFALFYATMGLPFGWLADKKRRTWIVGFGIALWSAATAFSGVAKNFGHMFLARMSVGVGEATLSPCAMSMIADSFPKEERGKPIAVYSTAMSLGAAAASFVGAAILTWAKSGAEVSLPLLGIVAPWQFAFIVVGLPGLLLSALFFIMREPVRRQVITGTGDESGSFGEMLRYVGKRWATYLSFMTIFSLMTIIAYSHGWNPAMFSRTWGWSAEQYAITNAIILIAVAPVTINVAGWLSDKMSSKGKSETPLLIAMLGVFFLVPTGVAIPLMPSGELAFVMIAFNTVGLAMISAVGVTALLNIVPSTMRGQIVALYYMCMSIAGLMLGPTSVGLLSDYVFGAEGLRYAVSLPALIFGIPVFLLMPTILRLYRRELAAFDAAEQAAEGAPKVA